MNHFFDTDLAKQYGVEEAIVIANFQYWIRHNAANGTNIRDGRVWTYNSYKAMIKLFPYWSEKQIRRIMTSLVNAGILMTANFNTDGFDKTMWYAFVEQDKFIPERYVSMCPNGQRQSKSTSAQMGTSSAQMGTPIPYNKQQIVNEQKKNKEEGELFFASSEAPSEVVVEVVSVEADAAQKKAPVAQPPAEVIGYKEAMKVYNDWHLGHVGTTPLIDGAQGKAMKGIIAYLRSQIKAKGATDMEDALQVKEAIAKSLELILLAMSTGRVESFLANQVKLTQIHSNITNIINQIKNGTGKQNRATDTTGASHIEDIRSKFASRNKGQ